MRLALAAFMLIVVFLRTGPLALELIATAVVAYECVAQPLGLARSGGRFRSRMWMAVTLGAVTLVAMWRDDMASGQSAGAALLGSPRLVAANLFCLFGLIACLVSPASAAKVGLGEVVSACPHARVSTPKAGPVAAPCPRSSTSRPPKLDLWPLDLQSYLTRMSLEALFTPRHIPHTAALLNTHTPHIVTTPLHLPPPPALAALLLHGRAPQALARRQAPAHLGLPLRVLAGRQPPGRPPPPSGIVLVRRNGHAHGASAPRACVCGGGWGGVSPCACTCTRGARQESRRREAVEGQVGLHGTGVFLNRAGGRRSCAWLGSARVCMGEPEDERLVTAETV